MNTKYKVNKNHKVDPTYSYIKIRNRFLTNSITTGSTVLRLNKQLLKIVNRCEGLNGFLHSNITNELDIVYLITLLNYYND